MSRYKLIGLLVCLSLGVFCIGFTIINKHSEEASDNNYIEVVDRLEAGADPSLGIIEFADEDYSVDETFVSHLPLVVIETVDEIPNAYYFNHEERRFMLKDDAIPYVSGQISIINNDDFVNHIGDEPEMVSHMQIKYRGNSSIMYDKHQYRINLTDESGASNEENVLGMGYESDWILNISMIDESLIRNYMVYTICAQIMDYTPDVRFCEVIIKNGDKYQYEGIYLMMEVVEQGKERVDISEYSPKNSYASYLVRRDRYDEEGVMLDTYATRNELCYGFLDLRYPKGDKLNDKVIDYVTNDISSIEQIIFSDNEDEFMKYSSYIDEDSFVDYFLVNEFFTNYDAGNNSTYMYKDTRGKLCIGPVWDYDNCADNQGEYLLNAELISFEGQPWFAQLLQSESFCKKLEERYYELRKTYFSDEYINRLIDNTVAYMGNAQKRDWSRWHQQYTAGRFELIKDSDGIVIDRNYTEYDDVVQRLKDVLNDHANYIEPEIKKLSEICRYKEAYKIHYSYAFLVMTVFFASIIIVRRSMR